MVQEAIGQHVSFDKNDPLMSVGLDSLQASQLIDDLGSCYEFGGKIISSIISKNVCYPFVSYRDPCNTGYDCS
jgi:hypothetical protein